MSTLRNDFVGSMEDDPATQKNFDAKTRNYPQEGDTTSSGGYSASPNVWSNKAQRGGQDPYKHGQNTNTRNPAGAIQQSTNGSDLRPELDDAKQGEDYTPEATF